MNSASHPGRGDAGRDADWDGPAPSMAPADLLHDPPVTQRGARRRAELIAAARVVFERSGFLDSKLTDITREAKCSTGSFYTYFNNKEEVFAAVLQEAQEDMLHPGMGRVAGTDHPYAVLEASNRAYLEAYRRNARLMVLLEQVASIDPRFRELRRRRGETFIRRNARSIAELQKRGIADPELDPMLASRALSGMVSRLAYSTLALGDAEAVDFDVLVTTLTRLWANALRIPERAAAATT
ncbi:TetR/AcrR family transcriptional regulator [Rhodococcus sp. 14C212]|uniref:TetR/AcrR family transcriptional regulator n=1 Tax=Rhodococcus sp. 14C212 TaxID=2711209 RepID=UPI0013ED5CA8|nr:TetR/AcrR family transcriptional regulator [Rhodococcus sp. 14C212]NGP04788.1 TetR/AcrR family transcriptional regulator [Rhodococcus sp. 14C212]